MGVLSFSGDFTNAVGGSPGFQESSGGVLGGFGEFQVRSRRYQG